MVYQGGKYDDKDGARESITEHNAHNNEEQFLSDEVIIRSYKKMKDVFDANDFSKIIVDYKKLSKTGKTGKKTRLIQNITEKTK